MLVLGSKRKRPARRFVPPCCRPPQVRYSSNGCMAGTRHGRIQGRLRTDTATVDERLAALVPAVTRDPHELKRPLACLRASTVAVLLFVRQRPAAARATRSAPGAAARALPGPTCAAAANETCAAGAARAVTCAGGRQGPIWMMASSSRSNRAGDWVGGHALGIGSATAMDGSDRPQPLASILLLSHVGVLLPCLDA